jgi:hypothetical protein
MGAARRILCAVAALSLGFPGAASARLQAVVDDPVGMALMGDRVVAATVTGELLRLSSAPVSGGPFAPFADVPVGRDYAGVELAGAPQGAAVAVWPLAGRGRLVAFGADGAPRLSDSNLGDPPISGRMAPLHMTALGALTLEGSTNAFLRDGTGPAREVALPPGTDPEMIAAAGTYGVAPSPEGALVVFDLRTDVEVGAISLGRFDPGTLNGLSVSPSGEVAASVPSGDGGDVLLWAPAGASRVRVVAVGREFGRVVAAGGLVAFVRGDGRLDEGERVEIIDPARRRVVFRGPWVRYVSGLAFDGRSVAFWSGDCGFVSPASPGSSRASIPAGACFRSEVEVNRFVPAVVDGRYRLRVACVSGYRECRVNVRITRRGRILARARARVSHRTARILSIPVRRSDGLRVRVDAIDPDGRTRVLLER